MTLSLARSLARSLALSVRTTSGRAISFFRPPSFSLISGSLAPRRVARAKMCVRDISICQAHGMVNTSLQSKYLFSRWMKTSINNISVSLSVCLSFLQKWFLSELYQHSLDYSAFAGPIKYQGSTAVRGVTKNLFKCQALQRHHLLLYCKLENVPKCRGVIYSNFLFWKCSKVNEEPSQMYGSK